MKHVTEQQLKKAIFMDGVDFLDLVEEEAGMELTIDAYGIEKKDDDWADDFMEDLKKVLSAYFDVTVTSVHTDNCDESLGVWIVYKD